MKSIMIDDKEEYALENIAKNITEEEKIFKLRLKAEINGRLSVIEELLKIKFGKDFVKLADKLSSIYDDDIYKMEDIIKKIMTPYYTLESLERVLLDTEQDG